MTLCSPRKGLARQGREATLVGIGRQGWVEVLRSNRGISSYKPNAALNPGSVYDVLLGRLRQPRFQLQSIAGRRTPRAIREILVAPLEYGGIHGPGRDFCRQLPFGRLIIYGDSHGAPGWRVRATCGKSDIQWFGISDATLTLGFPDILHSLEILDTTIKRGRR